MDDNKKGHEKKKSRDPTPFKLPREVLQLYYKFAMTEGIRLQECPDL